MNDKTHDLNDLSFFAAVVKHGGISAAARSLAMPKSRISRRIRTLEERLGVRLIERTTRSFSVTEVGQRVFHHANSALLEVEAIDTAVSSLKAEPQGLVRVSCPVGIERILLHALPAFLQQHPKLRVQFLLTNRAVDLIEEGVDIAIWGGEHINSNADFQVKIIGRRRAMLVASPGFLEQYGRPATPADLPSFPTLGRTEQPGPQSWTLVNMDGVLETVQHEPRLSIGDFSVLMRAAVEGLGIALLTGVDGQIELDSGRLVRVLPDWSTQEVTVYLTFTSRRGMLPGVRAVIDFIATTISHKTAKST